MKQIYYIIGSNSDKKQSSSFVDENNEVYYDNDKIGDLIKNISEDSVLEKISLNSHVMKEYFLSALLCVKISYESMEDLYGVEDFENETSMMILNFIANLKNLLDAIKYTNFHDDDLFKSVNLIRNYIIHGLEKKDDLNLSVNNNTTISVLSLEMPLGGENVGLFEISVYDSVTSVKIDSIIFSTRIFYKLLIELLENIVEF